MTHCFRLRRGADLLGSIEEYAKRRHIAAGAVLSGVGCVYAWTLRDAGGEDIHSAVENAEIVSLTGTVSENGCHLHASFSRRDLSVFGGHLCRGCLVNTTAELVLEELERTVFTREADEETGYDELVIKERS